MLPLGLLSITPCWVDARRADLDIETQLRTWRIDYENASERYWMSFDRLRIREAADSGHADRILLRGGATTLPVHLHSRIVENGRDRRDGNPRSRPLTIRARA